MVAIAPAQKFGRRLRVTVGNRIICDLDPEASASINLSRNLHVDVKTISHVKIEPMPTEITVFGLLRETQDALDDALAKSRTVPWTAYVESQTSGGELPPELAGVVVKVEAGYGRDLSMIANAAILPAGLEHTDEAPGTVTKIKAQDYRLPWKNAFGDESLLPGVSLEDLQRVLSASSGFGAGEEADAAFQSRFAEFTARNPTGIEGNFALSGDVKTVAYELLDELGLEAFFVNGEYRYLRRDAITLAEAVVLTKGVDVLSDARMPRGFRKVRVLFEALLSPGRQVLYRTPDGRPVGQGTFRVDHVEHDLSSWQKNYWTTVVLRPSNIQQIDNAEAQ